MSYLVGNPKDRFSHVAPHIINTPSDFYGEKRAKCHPKCLYGITILYLLVAFCLKKIICSTHDLQCTGALIRINMVCAGEAENRLYGAGVTVLDILIWGSGYQRNFTKFCNIF